MKKMLYISLAILLCIGLSACSGECSCDCPYCCEGSQDAAIADKENSAQGQSAEESSQQATVMEEIKNAVLSVEDFEIVKIEDDALYFKVKIRNISDIYLDTISFEYKVLDANGDILCDQTCGASNVAAGQAIWAGPYSIRDLNVEEADAVSFVSNPYGNNPQWLKEIVVFPIEDYA